MATETPAAFAQILGRAASTSAGWPSVGEFIVEQPGARGGLGLRRGGPAGIPATVSVAVGTDTIHMHPNIDLAAVGAASGVDFRLLCSFACELGGGVWINAGSAVILPEVFLKAVTVARNLGHSLDGLTAANLDMIRHYRPGVNVVGRPVAPGFGVQITGHYESLWPMLRLAVLEQLMK